MFIPKHLFIIFILGICSRSYSQDTTVVELRGCVSSSVCEDKEIAAEQEARSKAVFNFEIESDIAASQQTDACKARIKDNFEKSCNSQLYRNLKIEIEAVKESINEKNAQVAQTQKSITGAASESQDSVEQIINRLKVLITGINELQTTKLTPLETTLKKLTEKCELEFELVNQICQAPVVGSVGDKTVIHKMKIIGTSSSVEKAIVPEGTAQVSSVTAVAKVNASGSIDAPEVEAARQAAGSGYANTSRVGGSTYETFEETSYLAVATLNQASATITRLREFSVGPQNTGVCDAFGNCEKPESPTADPLGRDLPLSMGVPVDEPTSAAVSKAASTGGNTGGGVSGDQVMADAQSGAYGPSGSETGGTAQGGAASGGSAQGGIGGMMSGLSSLGSLFGKSGSSFGNDSSYGSNQAGSRYNNSSGNGSGNYAIPTDNSYSSNYKNQPSNNPALPSSTAFGGGVGSASGGGYGTPSADNGGSGSSLGGSSAKGGFNNSAKPSLLSRIFGKKDKTFLGKSMGGKGGGYGSSSRSGRSGSGSYDGGATNKDLLLKADGRSFDPSKYAPSKAAEDRAYARATGRKIASHTNGNTDGSAFWPNDISRDKRRNMFSKVTVIHKMNLDLNK